MRPQPLASGCAALRAEVLSLRLVCARNISGKQALNAGRRRIMTIVDDGRQRSAPGRLLANLHASRILSFAFHLKVEEEEKNRMMSMT